jgi:hypothetical protein
MTMAAMILVEVVVDINILRTGVSNDEIVWSDPG